MAGTITINPNLVTNAANTFNVSSAGYITGTAQNDPAVRNELASGVVSLSASSPMWGGVAITESTPTLANYANSIGSVLSLATSEANLTGFTVFDQSNAMINNPQSPAPLAPAGGGINFYRLGSGARIALPCSSATAVAFQGAAVNTAVYWDYTNQVVLSSPGGTALPGVLVVGVDSIGQSQIVTYNGTGSNITLSNGFILIPGAAAWTYTGYAVVLKI